MLNWNDDIVSSFATCMPRMRFSTSFLNGGSSSYLSYAEQGAAFLSISASDPELMKDVDPGRIARAKKTASIELKEHSDNLMNNRNVWCVASVPTPSWAAKVFPGIPQDQAVEKLWNAILTSVRADDQDPVEAWKYIRLP